METESSKIYIVRIIDHKSNPMIGIICPTGEPGTMCWDPECRTFYPHTMVLVDPHTHNIIKEDIK